MIFVAIRANNSSMMRATGKPTMAELQSAAKLLSDAGIDPEKIGPEEEYEIDTTLLTVTRKPRTTEPPKTV